MVDYTLYSLLAKAGDDDEADLFSPHVWKTVLDLKYASHARPLLLPLHAFNPV